MIFIIIKQIYSLNNFHLNLKFTTLNLLSSQNISLIFTMKTLIYFEKNI